jgi:hypothetical protein
MDPILLVALILVPAVLVVIALFLWPGDSMRGSAPAW